MTPELSDAYLYAIILAAAAVGYLAGFTCSYLPRMLRPPKAPLYTTEQVRIAALTRDLIETQRKLVAADAVVNAHEDLARAYTALNRRAMFRALYDYRNPE